jgi:hypothetical protein
MKIKRIISFIAILSAISVFNLQNASAQKYGGKIISSVIGGKKNQNTNVNLALNSPNMPKSISNPQHNTYYVSLGGGYIIVDMGVVIFDGNGPDLKVYEIGNSYTNAVNEAFYVKGSPDMKPGSWIFLGEYRGDVVSIDLKTYNAANIRYIGIFDIPFRPNDQSETPGADIDAVEALNYK